MTFQLEDTPRNAAYGIPFTELSIVIVEPSRAMQTIIRSMLQPMRPKRMRAYETATDALRDMLTEPPNLVLTDWKMEPMSGLRLLKVMRHISMMPLCFVPVVVITGAPTRAAVESAFRAGAHTIMVKPFAPKALQRRLDWIMADDRPMILEGENWAIEGVTDVLDQQREREQLPSIIDQARAEAEAQQQEIQSRPQQRTKGDAQSIVDKIIAGELIDGDLPEMAFSKKSREIRSTPPEMSPTLRRLMQRREDQKTTGPVYTKATKQTKQSGKNGPVIDLKAKPNKSKTRWNQLWGG